MIVINDSTPIAMLTVGQLRIALQGDSKEQSTPVPIAQKYVYGIKGIMTLFSVCRPIAQKYKDTFLQPAIMQNGRKIIVDVEKAMQLFSEKKGGRR